jgi:hypothetical protein
LKIRLWQRGILTLAAASALLWPASLHAEEPSPTLQLDLRLSRRPPLVHPPPGPGIAETDAQQAMADVEVWERDAKAMREAVPRLPHRPDLSYDVVSGIQARGLSNALRRR